MYYILNSLKPESSSDGGFVSRKNGNCHIHYVNPQKDIKDVLLSKQRGGYKRKKSNRRKKTRLKKLNKK